MKQKEKTKSTKLSLIPKETIIGKIYYIRGKKVMLDRDLAELYGVETKVLKQAVKRNISRFPYDFMFQLNKSEMEIWRSQFVTSKGDIKGLRWLPMVFTEQGVAMLSSVLNSERAIHVNIQIIRIFTHLREMLLTHKELREKIEKLEKKFTDKLVSQDKQIQLIFETIKLLLKDNSKPKERIGFKLK